MTLCFVPKHEGGRTFPLAGPDNHQQRERTDYGEQEKLNKSQWDLTQAFFSFTGRKEALGQCSSMLHYCYVVTYWELLQYHCIVKGCEPELNLPFPPGNV